jgi:acyl carrier protein
VAQQHRVAARPTPQEGIRMLTQDQFIGIVRDQLRLPVTGDLEQDFDQVVHWRSIQLVRLFLAVEELTGCRVSVADLLQQRTARGIYNVFAGEDSTKGHSGDASLAV